MSSGAFHAARHNGILETDAISAPNVTEMRQLRCCYLVQKALTSSFSFDEAMDKVRREK